MLFALLAAVSAAIVIITTKAGLKNVDPVVALAIQSLFILTISWGLVAWGGNLGTLKSIDSRAMIFLVVAGVATTLSSVFSYKALSLGDASYVVSIERLSLVFAVILAVVFLKEKISWQIITGIVLMLAGAILIAMTEKSS